jgi:pimeloyl-ACP methyl ester carboxylesterase
MVTSKQSSNWRSPDELVHYVDMGSGDRTVVFLHGLFGTPEHWRCIMNELADDYRVIAPQLPVDHRNDRRDNGIRTLDELADHVDAFLSKLELAPFVICGNSLGGLVAIDICLRHPERVAGLVLAGSAGLYERSLTPGIRPQASREFVRAVISDIFHDPALITEELVNEWHEAMGDRNFVRFLLRVSRATRDRTFDDELRQLKLPTLIVWGRNDKVTPPDVAEAFKRQIDNAELRYIDECGHAPNVERPAIFSELLRTFLPACFPNNGVTTRPYFLRAPR